MAEIQLKGIIKRFGDIQTIHGVDLQIDDGDFVVFVGPSGCGKSTLLRLIAGLEDISGGDMYIGGQRVNDLPPPKRGIAMVFQSYALYPHMTIYENMAFGLKLAKQGKEEIDQRVRNAARILQMEHLLDRLPKELSGGQRQRVAIGRAIVRNPQVFLFDEPLSNLDAALRVQTRIEIYKLHNDLKTTMVYVTHDQVEAMTLADKIVVLNAGTVAQVGAPLELYHHPDNLFVAGFIGSPKMNFIDGTVDQVGDGQVSVKLKSGTQLNARVTADGAKPGDTVKVGIRPEHMVVDGSGGGNVQGEVMLVEHLGEGSIVYLRTPDLEDDTLVVRETGDTPIKAGETLTVTIPDKDTHLFNADGKAYRRQMSSSEESRSPAMSQA